MLVKMDSAEVVEACRDWLKKVHGLTPKGERVFVTNDAVGTGNEYHNVRNVGVTFPEVERSDPGSGPYREPAAR